MIKYDKCASLGFKSFQHFSLLGHDPAVKSRTEDDEHSGSPRGQLQKFFKNNLGLTLVLFLQLFFLFIKVLHCLHIYDFCFSLFLAFLLAFYDYFKIFCQRSIIVFW